MNNKMYIGQIAFTRFVAALWVVVFHYGRRIYPFDHNEDFGGFLHALARQGPVAVSYFFALSGFVMAIAYYKGKDGKVHYGSFMKARFARIYPIYIVALAGALALTLYSGNSIDTTPSLLSTVLLQSWIPHYATNVNTPAWSLSVEFFFYAIFPFTLLFMQRLKTWKVLAVGFGAWAGLLGLFAYAIQNGMLDKQWSKYVYYSPWVQSGTFLLGTAIGITFKRHYDQIVAKQWWVRGGLLASIAAFYICIWHRNLVSKAIDFGFSYEIGLLAPVFLAFIFTLSADRSPVSKCLSWKPLVVLGEVSYGMYILQEVMLRASYSPLNLFDGRLNTPGEFWLYASVLIGTALVAYYAIEKPCQKWIRSWGKAKAKPAIATPEAAFPTATGPFVPGKEFREETALETPDRSTWVPSDTRREQPADETKKAPRPGVSLNEEASKKDSDVLSN